MSSDEEEVGVKRRNPTRSARATRASKRRHIAEDDDEGDSEKAEPKPSKKESTESATKDEATEANNDSNNMKSRLLGRIKKTEERKRESKQKKGKEPAEVAEPSIPKKSTAIPRRSSSENIDGRPATTSLLPQTALPPATTNFNNAKPNNKPFQNRSRPESNTQSSTYNRSTSGGAGQFHRSTDSSNAQNANRRRPNTMTPPPIVLTPPEASPVPAVQSTSTTVTQPSKATLVLQDVLWESLAKLCSEVETMDRATFLLQPSSTGSVDLGNSFLKHEEFDWFDLDSTGAIVLQPKVPIFPEDFPPGKTEWPLSWWGIVDPAIGERKDAKVLTDSGEVTNAPQPQPDQQELAREERDRSSSHRRHNSRRSSSQEIGRSNRGDDRRRGGEGMPYERPGHGPRQPYRNGSGGLPPHDDEYPRRPDEPYWEGPPPGPNSYPEVRGGPPMSGDDRWRGNPDERRRYGDDRGPPRGGPPPSARYPQGPEDAWRSQRYPDDDRRRGEERPRGDWPRDDRGRGPPPPSHRDYRDRPPYHPEDRPRHRERNDRYLDDPPPRPMDDHRRRDDRWDGRDRNRRRP